MAEADDDALEAVQLAQHQRQVRAVQLGEPALQAAAMRQPGQRIVDGLVREDILRAQPRPHVVDHEQRRHRGDQVEDVDDGADLVDAMGGLLAAAVDHGVDLVLERVDVAADLVGQAGSVRTAPPRRRRGLGLSATASKRGVSARMDSKPTCIRPMTSLVLGLRAQGLEVGVHVAARVALEHDEAVMADRVREVLVHRQLMQQQRGLELREVMQQRHLLLEKKKKKKKKKKRGGGGGGGSGVALLRMLAVIQSMATDMPMLSATSAASRP